MSDNTTSSSFDRAQSDRDNRIGPCPVDGDEVEQKEFDKTDWLADIERDDNP